MTLDAPPASGKIRIVRRQREDRVEMLGQYHYCLDDEWAFSASRTQCIAKKIDAFHQDFGASIRKGKKKSHRG